MKTPIFLLLWAMIFSLGIPMVSMATSESDSIFYISTQGDDQWSGILPVLNSQRTDGPFLTLSGARDAVRASKKQDKVPRSYSILVREGIHFLPEPFLLTKEDSGSSAHTFTISAYKNEKPIFSGGKVISNWERYQGEIWKADLPWAKGGKWSSRQLFYKGVRQPRARYPKADPANPLYGGWAFTEAPAYNGCLNAFIYKPNTFPHHWAKPTEIEVVYYAGWGSFNSRVPIKTIDENRRLISLKHAGWQFDVPGWYIPVPFTSDNRFYIENALEDLTEPGEWCFDSEEGMLYFWPPETSWDKNGVTVPFVDGLVDLVGASWITLSGFTFTQTLDGDNFHREGVEGAGAMYPRPGWRYCGDAVHLKNTEYCRVWFMETSSPVAPIPEFWCMAGKTMSSKITFLWMSHAAFCFKKSYLNWKPGNSWRDIRPEM